MPYQVRTQAFEGPFDLLLHLIARRELDVYEISLAAITEDYLAHLRAMRDDLDLETATEFLVVAATLIEIKASRLLPGPPREDDGPDLSDRDLLVARLLEYRAFKEAAERLGRLLEENAGYVPRTAGPGEEWSHVPPDLLARVTPARLAEMAARALRPAPPPRVDTTHIAPIRVSVAEAVAELREALRRRGRASFRSLAAGADRLGVIVRFLAVLELVKRGEADVAQEGTFGTIEVRWLGERSEAPPVDEYDGAAAGGAVEPATERMSEVSP
jgi:segregation and condensation protein A